MACLKGPLDLSPKLTFSACRSIASGIWLLIGSDMMTSFVADISRRNSSNWRPKNFTIYLSACLACVINRSIRSASLVDVITDASPLRTLPGPFFFARLTRFETGV